MRWKIVTVILLSSAFVMGLFVQRGQKASETQITNNEAYLEFCNRASNEDEVFHQFKRDPVYELFQESVSFEEGMQLLKTMSSELLEPSLLEAVRKLDCVGAPHVFNFPSVGPFSPLTIYYLKMASDLKEHFGNMKKLCVIEIGGGLGGLCTVLHEVFDIEHYTIVDLEESLSLTKKHLEALGINHVQFMTPDDARLLPSDLLISYNGFSESSVSLQKRLIKKLVPGSERGYLVCRFYPFQKVVRSMKRDEILKSIKKKKSGMQVHFEGPKWGHQDCVVTWEE